MESALVVLSGGQDSTTCLYWAKSQFKVTALNILYNQRHLIECTSAEEIAKRAQVPFNRIVVGDLFQQIGDSALVNKTEDISTSHRGGQLPASFVPGRNILFLTIAAAYAYRLGIHQIVTGVCQTDYSGYPDCRQETIDNLKKTLSLALEWEFDILTPLMHLSKKQIVEMAIDLGVLQELAWTHTCYEGQYPPCTTCPACLLRAKGFKEAGIEDPLFVRAREEGLI